MADYAFVHKGKAYTPNRTAVSAEQAEAHNAAIEAAELEAWKGQPDRMLAYYTAPVGGVRSVTTWRGVRIGTVIRANIYRHNFGARFISLEVRGTNGARYYGRASYDNVSCVMLRKAKG